MELYTAHQAAVFLPALLFLIFMVFCGGALFGQWARDARWREKGDHPYMNRMASGGYLYQVKREP